MIMNNEDKIELNRILNTFVSYDESSLSKHSLTIEMVEMYRLGFKDQFKKLRKGYILSSRYDQMKDLMPELVD